MPRKPKFRHTGGNWNPQDPPLYFLATVINYMEDRKHIDLHYQTLIANNEIEREKDEAALVAHLDAGHQVFFDSGVFWLTNRHARKHDVHMDEALALAPEEIDGFQELFDRYVRLTKTYGDRLWGYIEIDQGGREQKIKTRARLEKLGLRPIPVYHPLNDGWDYFDYLAERYDRICFGNVVQASSSDRKRLLATAWERRRKYPNLWIHVLGLTPNEIYGAWPMNSCDSSSWAAATRWGTINTTAANKSVGSVNDVTYEKGSDRYGETGYNKAVRLAAYEAHMKALALQANTAAYESALGFDWKRGPNV